MDEAERSHRARQKLERGDLPRVNPERIWVHSGAWEPCALCSLRIDETETAYELQFSTPVTFGSSDLASFWFHAACYRTWLAERTRP